MQRPCPQVKIISLQNKTQTNKQTQLQLQLKQAYTTISVLKQTNKSLIDKVSYYQNRCEDMKLLEEQLQFRKEQEQCMQQHLDNYMKINAKLRDQLSEYQNTLKTRDLNKGSSCKEESQKFEQKRRMSLGFGQQFTKTDSGRRNIGESHKENHPLTPKSRVSINFQKIGNCQIDSILQLRAKRKVFM